MNLLSCFIENPAVERFNRKHVLSASSVTEEALVLCTSFMQNRRPMVVVKANLYSAQQLYERCRTLLPDGDCVLFSVEESLRVEAIAVSPESVAARVETLASLLMDPNRIVITHVAGMIRHLPKVSLFVDSCLHLETGMDYQMDELRRKLIQSGYQQVSHVDHPLTFAMRGGIIDVWSINHDDPIRVEFFDTEIDSIRFFDVSTQKTKEHVDEIDCICASDVLFSDQDIETIIEETTKLMEKHPDVDGEVEIDLEYITNHVSERRLYVYYAYLKDCGCLLDYVPNAELVFSDIEKLKDNHKHIFDENIAYIQEMVQEKKMLPKFAVFREFQPILDRKHSVVEFMDENISGIHTLDVAKENLPLMLSMIRQRYSDSAIYVVVNDDEFRQCIEACVQIKQPYDLDENRDNTLHILCGEYTEGFVAEQEKVVLVTSKELFRKSRKQSRFSNKFRQAEVLQSYEELNIQDYVVHEQYGVGQYMGIETREILGVHRDFLKIIYRGNAELLVPLEQFRLVRKFVSREGVVPRLNKLGSDEWVKTKEKIRNNVAEIAERLIDLYSQREEHIGHAFKEDDEMQKEFEAEFEYELTPDQAVAIEEMKKDMQSDKPMDRLLCGDVGFGKTEVAIRGAFKAVMENKQVAFLCPTTILAEQHYNTFRERFRNYPVEIRLLNRFSSPNYQKETIEGLKDGKVDIVIGTHRILSNDVRFKDLGFLVIDEEQRFGVEHKEKIKELKSSIDVLSLSATPIPRTLQMSLIGIRQLSQLDTAPQNRYAVQTYVVERNDRLIREVIERELARDGQVFYLYNNVEFIYNTARKIQSLLPDARVGIAHGQMGKEEIEDVMIRFNRHEIDVLVCTTIIETGIDIPNVNTILVDNAQNFGLSQLYQIKGRVGRSDRVAYAYLMIPERRQLSEVAGKRLQAIKEFTQLGSGYRIAMRDLTIRGAGDLLGPNQSGFIDTVGIDMYMEMLNEAIQEKKGIKVEETKEKETYHPPVNVDGYIPKDFAPDDYDKISMYQQIDDIHTVEELKEYVDQVIDEYGRLPKNVKALFDKKHLEILLNETEVEKFREIKGQIELTFAKSFSDRLDGVKLFELMNNISRDIVIRYTQGRIIVMLPKSKNPLQMCLECVIRAKEAIRAN